MQFTYRAIRYSLFLLCLCTLARAQDPAAPKPGFMHFVRDFGKEEAARSVEKFRNGRIGIRQEQLLQELRQTSGRARIFLRKGLDTARLKADLVLAQQQLTLLREGIFHGAPQHAARHLTVTASVLDELLEEVTEKREALERRLHTLIGFVDRIDSLSADSSLYTFPFDSLHTARYIQKMAVVAKELGPADTALRRSVTALQRLQTEADLMVFTIRSTREDVEQLRMAQVARTFEQEYPYLWQPPSPDLPPGKILALSYAKEKLAWAYYVRDAGGRLLVLLLLTLAAWYFLHSLKKKWQVEGTNSPEQPSRLVLRYPLLSAIVIVPSIFQFIFLQPPYIFSCGLWLTGAICLAFIFHGYITPFWMWFWIIAITFFILSSVTNMILPASRQERWWMLLLSAASLAYGAYVLRLRWRAQVREKRILYFISFLVVMEACALLFNVAGRYNLAKTIFVTGFAGLVIAILFLWTIRFINEGLSTIAAIYKHPERKFFYLDFERIGEKAPGFFYVFLVVGWFVLIGRNFYALQEAVAPVADFLHAERTLGSYTFTISSLLIFILVIVVSALLSQIISFFAGERGDQHAKDKQARRPGVGSWLLLIRIFVLALGLFLAFAAAGIPLDKMAIALGALGIGIGLGLQGLVSNLVSGLIIAFEKPVNVGDIIEVNGMRGTMKAIGFRSSVVALIDGPSLIIPNGDLLSQHLINWTMGQNRKRVNLVIGVAYGSHLRKVKEILEAVLHDNERVLRLPEPVVSVKAFGDSSIDFDLYFWVGHVREYLQIRSEVISSIDEAFRLEGITIPFPQRDIHVITGKIRPSND
ncbi:mechanosensitive ion channel domain-containing protein [Chitinophaga alhagiae]|uniref:mechanosensitive ion channel domain-containing protein n=1 Tax=Chitinophaga alhagiae TaxID=2203219 RepID=UPI001300A341|nr:mechanosensitive ion channel domain-containing protein [Chitinophaga alhagiae]